MLASSGAGGRAGEAGQLGCQVLHQGHAGPCARVLYAALKCLQPGACLALRLRLPKRSLRLPMSASNILGILHR